MADSVSLAGLPPGFDDDKSWVAIFTVSLCLTVATLMVGLRIYTRMFITKQMGMDDWAAVITLVGSLGMRGLETIGLHAEKR